MNLHDDKDVFEELILATAEDLGLPQAYIEKDYWVTKVLRNLSDSGYRDDFVFKGGTSLSKAHGLIHRFSEDVDLAVANTSWGSSKIKMRIKEIGQIITEGLEYFPDHPGEAKHGRFRKTYYRYPKLDDKVDLDHASGEILLEVNAMAPPEPHAPVDIQCLIAKHLTECSRTDLVHGYGLEAFPLNVLDVDRTAAEKVIALVRASREDDDGDSLRRKIRHVYDLCMIARRKPHFFCIESDSLPELLKTVCDSDKKVFQEASKWVDPPLYEAPLFKDPVGTWKKVSGEFEGSFSRMVYNGEIPDSQEIVDLLKRLQQVLQRV